MKNYGHIAYTYEWDIPPMHGRTEAELVELFNDRLNEAACFEIYRERMDLKPGGRYVHTITRVMYCNLTDGQGNSYRFTGKWRRKASF